MKLFAERESLKNLSMKKLEHNWKFKTLENLEKKPGPKIDFDSHLVTRTTHLRKVPLNEFTVEDLRIMIGQNFSLFYLIPLALEKLEENILCEGDLMPGDLLRAVTKSDPEFWIEYPEYKRKLEELVSVNSELIKTHNLKF
jgi:hypothetical protein